MQPFLLYCYASCAPVSDSEYDVSSSTDTSTINTIWQSSSILYPLQLCSLIITLVLLIEFVVLISQIFSELSNAFLLAGDHALHCLFMSGDILVYCYGDVAAASVAGPRY